MVTEVLNPVELKEQTRVAFVRMPKSLHAELKEKTTNAEGDTSMNSFCVMAIRIALLAKEDCVSYSEPLPSNFQDALLSDDEPKDGEKNEHGEGNL